MYNTTVSDDASVINSNEISGIIINNEFIQMKIYSKLVAVKDQE